MADLSHTPTGRAADADAADRSYVGLAKQICDLIAAGDVGPRARLPSERTLAERFGVSRTQVREAIIALEVQGVVEVRVGSGIYVAEAPGARSVTFELPRRPGPIEPCIGRTGKPLSRANWYASNVRRGRVRACPSFHFEGAPLKRSFR